jgi:hypothetical protein
MPRGPRRIPRFGPPCPDCGETSQEDMTFDDPRTIYVCLAPPGDCRVDSFDDQGTVLTTKT